MKIRKLLLFSLLTCFSWLTAIGQNVVNVYGTVNDVNGAPQYDVNILISAFFADSTAYTTSIYTGVDGTYSENIPVPAPNMFGYVEVSMVDCWGTLETQYFTILNGNEVFQADFVYCEEIVMDSCSVFIVEEWNPDGILQLTAWTPPGLGATYLWNTGETSQTIIPQVSGDFCVTATFDSGCEQSDCTYVYLDSTSFCFAYIVSYLENDSLYTLEAIPSGVAPYTYLWSTGATTSSIQNNPPGTYCVTVTDATGCAYPTCIIVDNINFCEVYIYEDPATGGLYAQGYGQDPITYVWDNGDTSQVIYPNAPGLYCVSMYDANGCSSTSCYQYGGGWDSCFVYVYAFIADSNTLAIQAVGGSANNNVSYLWNTGDTTDIIYPTDLSQSYCVTMTDGVDCSATACFNLSDYCYAWVDLQYLDTTTANLTVYTDPIFNLPGLPSPEYLWSNGATTQTLTVDSSGEYCVTVTLGNVCVTEACTYVDFENLDTSCSAWVYTYADSSGQWYAEAVPFGWGVFEFNWSNGDTNAITQIASPNHYTCVTVTSNLGCETVACADTLFFPCDVVVNLYYVNNQEAILTASTPWDPNQNATYEWSNGETGPSITVNIEGTYCVTAMTAGCAQTSCLYVSFNQPDSCGVWISEDSSSGSGTLYTANAWGVAPFQYQWSNGETSESTFVDFGIHDLCVTVTDASGCQSYACNYQVDSCYADILYVEGPIPTLYLQTSDPLWYVTWSTGDSTPWLVITDPGTYCATVVNLNGCVAETCITIDTLVGENGANSIAGVVFADSLNAFTGYVNAYLIDPSNGSYPLADSVEIGANGTYAFVGLPDGNYIVKAVVDNNDPNTPGYLPTYHLYSTNWQDAFPRTLPNWLPTNTDIFMIRATGLTGGGVIGGFVTDPNHLVANEESEQRGLTGLGHVEVLLSDVNGQPMQHFWTLQDGSFRFPDLPFGTYRLSYDIPGIQSPDIWVTLTPEDPERLQVTLIVNQGTTSVEEPVQEELRLYPNPANQEVNIPLPGINMSYALQMVDMQGKVVYTGSAKNYNGVITVNVGSYAPGLYHLNIKGDQGIYYGRFIKQE